MSIYVAFVPGVTGAHTQAETLDELQVKKEAIGAYSARMDPGRKKKLLQLARNSANRGCCKSVFLQIFDARKMKYSWSTRF